MLEKLDDFFLSPSLSLSPRHPTDICSLFWCHHCDCCHDVSREAPLCAISIVTWNFSFELLLSFALFGQGAVRGPCINNSAAKTTLHALRWAQPESAVLVTWLHVADACLKI